MSAKYLYVRFPDSADNQPAVDLSIIIARRHPIAHVACTVAVEPAVVVTSLTVAELAVSLVGHRPALLQLCVVAPSPKGPWQRIQTVDIASAVKHHLDQIHKK